MSRARVHGESGWVGRALTSAVAVGVLITARPAESWAWIVLGIGLAVFLAGTFLMNSRPYWAFALLTYAALSSALLVGMPGSNALVITLVSVTDIAVMALPQGYKPIIAVGIGCVLAYAGSGWWWDRSDTWFLSQLTWTAILIAFGLNRRQYEIQARQTAQLLEQTRLAQQEQARAAALDERGRIARELHDVLAHSLGALSVQLELAEALAERDDPAGALERVRRSRRLAVQGLTEARNAVAALRNSDVPALPEAIAVLAEQHGKDHRVEVALVTEGTPRALESGVTVALLGVAREAMTNAAKHAAGQAVGVLLDYRDGVRLEIRNGLPPAAEQQERLGEQGFGLAGMRERLALVLGELTAGPDADCWLVVAELPADGAGNRVAAAEAGAGERAGGAETGAEGRAVRASGGIDG